jgi:Holliday junction resolvase
MKRPVKEATASRALCKKLEAAGWHTWRIETRQASGFPDIVAGDKAGHLVFIETKRFLKTKGDVLYFNPMSPAQIAFAMLCERAGVKFLLAILGGKRPLLIQSRNGEARSVITFDLPVISLALSSFREMITGLGNGKLTVENGWKEKGAALVFPYM